MSYSAVSADNNKRVPVRATFFNMPAMQFMVIYDDWK